MIEQVPTTEKQRIINVLEKELSKIYSTVSSDVEYAYNAVCDNLLHDCKEIIYAYLDNPLNIEDISNQDLTLLYEFLMIKSEYLRSVKITLGISDNINLPIVELGDSISQYNQHKQLSKNCNDTFYSKIDKNIEHIQSELTFCYSVFRKIINERDIFRT